MRKSRRVGVSFVLMCLLLFAGAISGAAQGGVGSTRGLPETSGGSNLLEGKIRLPTGRSAGQGFTVKLEGTMVTTRTAVTDHDGTFVFRSLPSGEYYITVDGGADYETIRQPLTIHGTAGGAIVGSSARVLSVNLHLFPKGRSPAEEEVFLGVPDSAVDTFKKGREAARAGNAKKAIEFYKSALAIHPHFNQVLSELGVQYLKLGEMEHLAETMTALLKLNANDGRAHLHLGIALYNLKKFSEAETHLRKAVELNGADAPSHYYLGITLVSLKHYAEAEKELELSIKNGGDSVALAHRYLGGLYMSSKKHQQAADELEKYLKLDPKAADAERIKGTIKELRNKQ